MPRRRLRIPADALKDTRNFDRRSSLFFTVRAKANALGHHRFAVIVSARADRRAAARHSLKRRTAAHLSRSYAHSAARAGLRRSGGRDIIVSIHPPARDLSRKEFYIELDKLL